MSPVDVAFVTELIVQFPMRQGQDDQQFNFS